MEWFSQKTSMGMQISKTGEGQVVLDAKMMEDSTGELGKIRGKFHVTSRPAKQSRER